MQGKWDFTQDLLQSNRGIGILVKASCGPALQSASLWNQVKPAGELCRPMKDKCDLEEFCDGQKPTCPEDAFQQNGTPCPGGYCFDGSCPTLAQQCQALWGPGEADIGGGGSLWNVCDLKQTNFSWSHRCPGSIRLLLCL